MKRLFLVSLAIVLVMSLGIAMFPIQSVEAGQNGGRVFNITAKGQGDYSLKIHGSGTTNGTGEFSIRIAGEASNKGGGLYGVAFAPDAEVGGHISGSFGGHTIHAGLQGNDVHFDCNHGDLEPFRLIHVTNLTVRGNFDGEKIETASNKSVSVYYDSVMQTNIIEVYLHNFPSPYADLTIWMYETGEKAADTFKVNIH